MTSAAPPEKKNRKKGLEKDEFLEKKETRNEAKKAHMWKAKSSK